MELLGKLLPTLAVAAVLGYCAWSEEDPTDPTPEQTAGKKTEAGTGSGPLRRPTRDPFRMPGEPASSARGAKAPAGKDGPPAAGKEIPGAPGTLRAEGLVLRATYL